MLRPGGVGRARGTGLLWGLSAPPGGGWGEPWGLGKRNGKQYCTVKPIKEVCQVTCLKVKIEKFVGGNSMQSFAFSVTGMFGGGIYLQVSV